MSHERWREISRLYHSALTKGLEERAAFLAAVCIGDEALRQEVESLLAQENKEAGFLTVSMFAPALDATPGTPASQETTSSGSGRSLAGDDIFADRYQVQNEIGRGGFGVVYRAFDRSPLQRTVALKIMRFSLGESEEAALARRQFMDEARMAGSLSHANIATIFERN